MICEQPPLCHSLARFESIQAPLDSHSDRDSGRQADRQERSAVAKAELRTVKEKQTEKKSKKN